MLKEKKDRIKRHPQFFGNENRENTVDVWLDETLRQIQNDIKKIYNTKNSSEKDCMIANLLKYVSGLIDGNRFNKKNPYKNNEFIKYNK